MPASRPDGQWLWDYYALVEQIPAREFDRVEYAVD